MTGLPRPSAPVGATGEHPEHGWMDIRYPGRRLGAAAGQGRWNMPGKFDIISCAGCLKLFCIYICLTIRMKIMEEIAKDTIINASRGDMNAFATIYRNTSGFVYNVALRTAGSYDVAADITQDVFLKVYEELKNFRHVSKFQTWLYRITVNMTLNVLKKNSKYANKTIDINDIPDSITTENSVHDQIERNARNEELQKLLDTLPEDQKICIVLRNIEDMSYKEIAGTLGININTVRTRLKRARENLLKRAGGGKLNEMY